MKNTNEKTYSYQPSPAGSFASASRRLALTAILLSSLAISTSAQEAGSYKIAAERGFTVVPNVQTPIVLKTMPDAACDLHAAGASESSPKLRFYANGDGYVKIHANARQESEDGIHAQLDCQANGNAVHYPLHLRASSSSTPEMPAPQIKMPVPKGSQVIPALSQQEAETLTDQELIGRGFPPRPDASRSPDDYAKWLDLTSHPITMVTPHLVSRSDISHSASLQGGSQQPGEQNSFGTSSNWSGYISQGSFRGFIAAYGQWNIPRIAGCESNTTTYSSFWVGLDGWGTSDLVQDGTEQDCTDFLGFNFTSYSAWEELLPNQPTSSNVSLSPNPGDSFWALAWVGDANRYYDPNGTWAWFNMWDTTQKQGVLVGVPLGSTFYNGSVAEWVMERPTVGGKFAQLSDYGTALMTSPSILTSSFAFDPYSSFAYTEIWLYNNYQSGNDNNLLSAAAGSGSSSIYYYWFNYH